MIEPNNKKTFICVNVHTADDKCQYETFFWWEILKPGQTDSIRDTGTEYHKPGLFRQNRFVRLFLFWEEYSDLFSIYNSFSIGAINIAPATLSSFNENSELISSGKY